MLKLKKTKLTGLMNLLLVGLLSFSLISCSDDEDGDGMDKELMSGSFEYEFHNGQTVETAPYDGTHHGNLSAELAFEELETGGTMVMVTLMNTIEGEMYPVHAHDAADPASTPNGTPYNETPNSDLLVQMAEGNGGTVMVSQETEMTFEEITSEYEGFFVVHDPLQPINTADITTYLVVGSFAREQASVSLETGTFDYDFNTGQLVEAFAYAGTHATDLGAQITVQELVGGSSRVSVDIMNSLDGETYATHAHDVADADTTVNNTPYNETPNADVFVQMIQGNGTTVRGSQISTYSYGEITTSYEGFFVIHDPLQDIDTTDPTTYVVLGSFAR